MATTFVEALYKGYAQTFEVKGRYLVDEQSSFQRIRIFDSALNGRILVLDDIVQLTDRDECAYSEMLTHVPILELGGATNVLVAGGGDAAIAEEVLKHKSVRHLDMVEIDGRVVETCKEHFSHINAKVFGDPRFHLHVEDAFEFMKRAPAGHYDVIITDRPDPVGPAKVLFATQYYELIKRCLSPKGVAVFQNGVPHYQPDELSDTYAQHRQVFGKHGVMVSVVPTYVGGFMALTWGSEGTDLGKTVDLATLDSRFKAAGFETDYYTPRIHLAAFALPRWIERLVA
jgi:spermidine synthase